MRRTAVLLAVLFAMLWQGMALARPGSTLNVGADVQHVALHWQDEGHHHHDDGSYHIDGSTESMQHVVADHVSASAVLMTSGIPDFLSPSAALPTSLRERPPPHPFVDGLLRPPRFRA